MLRKNNLSNIEEGALDHLVKLQFLDLRGNDFLEEYTTNATFSQNVCSLALTVWERQSLEDIYTKVHSLT